MRKTMAALVLVVLGAAGMAAGSLPHPGDLNNDGSVDIGDLGILAFNWHPGYPILPIEPWDPNGDGYVDVGDLGIIAFNWGWRGDPAGPGCPPPPEAMDDLGVLPQAIYPNDPWPGDANNDGVVNVGDLGIIAFNWGRTSDPPPVWIMGNMNGDHTVDIGDLAVLAFNWNWSGPPAQAQAVPEPITLALVGVGALAILRRRR